MFCSYCGQAAAANASSCAHCGKPLRSAPAQSSSLVAFTVIFAITTIVAGWVAVYYAREAAQAQAAIAMISLSRSAPPPPPTTARTNGEQPCDLGVVGGVPGGVPGGQMGGVIGGIIGEPPPPSKTPKRVRISGSVAQANLISQTPPVYPQMAKMAKVQGPVVLQVILGKAGTVENLRVISGHPMLVQAALDAVRQWRYKPYLLNGEPVEVETQVTVSFKLVQ
jgi:TonB family protein